MHATDPADPEAKALACYGLWLPGRERMLLRFVAGRPVSPVTCAFLAWVAERLAAEGMRELTAVWVPDPTHEAMRDLVRARTAAMETVRRARQQLQGFLLRHDRVFTGRKAWSPAHRRWLVGLRFAHPAQQIVLQEQIDAIEEAERRRDRLGQQIRELVPDGSLAPVVTAVQAMRGIAFLSAVGLTAEVGDFRRFTTPRQLMAWLGLVPSEHSSGAKVERGGITKAGNGRARRVLVEGAGATASQRG